MEIIGIYRIIQTNTLW